MPDMRKAMISLISEHDGNKVTQKLPAEVIVKGTYMYARYEEKAASPTGGTIRNLLKIGPDSIKLVRHGEIESEQSFQLGKRLPGFYRSPYSSFNLSTDTKQMKIDLKDMTGHLSWTYDLYVFENLTDQFTISLHIQEEQ